MTKKKPPRTEKEIHKQAFDCYCRLGSGRKYRLVASKFGVSRSTIKNWARDFKWQERFEKWSAEITNEMIERTKSKAVEGLERDLKVCNLIEGKGAKDIADGRSRVTAKDVLKAMETKRRLLEMKHKDVDDEGNPASDRPNLFIIDNDRSDCTLPRATGPDGKTEDEAERPENTDKD